MPFGGLITVMAIKVIDSCREGVGGPGRADPASIERQMGRSVAGRELGAGEVIGDAGGGRPPGGDPDAECIEQQIERALTDLGRDILTAETGRPGGDIGGPAGPGG